MSCPGLRMGWQKPDELRGRKEEGKQASSTQGLRDRLRGGLIPSRYVRNTFLRVAELFLKICKSQLSRWQRTLSDEAMPFHLSMDAFFFSDRNMSFPPCLSVSPPLSLTHTGEVSVSVLGSSSDLIKPVPQSPTLGTLSTSISKETTPGAGTNVEFEGGTEVTTMAGCLSPVCTRMKSRLGRRELSDRRPRKLSKQDKN